MTYTRESNWQMSAPLHSVIALRDKLDMLTLKQARELPEAETGCGVYFLWWKDELQYVGGSKNLYSRMHIHWCAWRYGNLTGGYKQRIPYDKATALAVDDPKEMRRLEREYIAHFAPPYNVQSKTR